MPPAANPNPDRARRAASVAPAAEAKDESDKEDDIVDADFEVVDDEKGKS